MANPVTPDGTDTLDYSACQNCDWRGPTVDTREIKDLHQRVDPGEPMPSGECPECGALCQPTDDDGTTQPICVVVDCTADVRETWFGDAPAHLEDDELHEWCDEQLSRGDLHFDEQDVTGERDREINRIITLDAPWRTAPEGPIAHADDLDALKAEIKSALEGDSNDAEHDALAAVADHFGIEWTSFEDREEDDDDEHP